MAFLTGAGIIDDAMSTIRNNSTSIRTKMLRWLNILAQKLVVARPTGWTFLENGSTSLTPVANVLTMPADYGQLKSIQAGTSFFFDNRHRLTDAEAYIFDNGSTGLSAPKGYTESIDDVSVGQTTVKRYIITLRGAGYSEALTVNYKISPADFADSESETAWPPICRPVLMRGLLDAFYEYDMDERAALSYQLNASDLGELINTDNLRKPRSQSDSRGLRRTP